MKKTGVVVAVLSVSLFLAACGNSSSGESKLTAVKSGKTIEDIHGVGVSKDGTTYVATHEGLFSIKSIGQSWEKVEGFNNDLMGFHMRTDGSMMTSGHPGIDSDLPNPIGIFISKDKGLHWKKVEYVGKIDFHVLTSDFNDPDTIYGLNEMGTGQYGAGIYKSTDGGGNWTKINPKGLPSDLMKVHSLLVVPQDRDMLLAGTELGVMMSMDGGKTWGMYDNTRLITAMTVMPNGKDIVAYSMGDTISGVMISQDSGKTWTKVGLDLGKDAASAISVNSKDEKQMAVSTFKTSLYETNDGGQTWKK